jgi:hypothetical protein
VSSVRKTLRSIAVALGVFTGFHILIAGTPHVSVAERSPDRRSVAELYETDWFIDRHFRVRVATFWLGFIPIRRVAYTSADEGARGGERLLWSRDGRQVLLVGPRLFGIDGACLASGDVLYLLVDTHTWAIASNSSRPLHRRFPLEDLAGMDCGVSLTPGMRAPRSQKCIAQAT